MTNFRICGLGWLFALAACLAIFPIDVLAAQEIGPDYLDLTTDDGKVISLANVSRITQIENSTSQVTNKTDSIGDGFDNNEGSGNGTEIFADSSASSTTNNPACRTELKSLNLIVGASLNRDFCGGVFAVGAFFEMGRGEYKSRKVISPTTMPRPRRFKGKGDVDNYGGGLLAVARFNGGFGFDASFRAGRVSSDLDSNIREEGMGITSLDGFDSSTGYLSAHLGVSYTREINERFSIRFYDRFLWTYQGSDKAKSDREKRPLGGFEEYRFRHVSSARNQLGARLLYDFTASRNCGYSLRGYIDAAWEYEADGRIRFNYFATENPNGVYISGLRTNRNGGIFQIGGVWRQNRDRALRGWEIKANLTAFSGDKHGIAGIVGVAYGF